jgi:polar amino acid transport system substrate-binding protein
VAKEAGDKYSEIADQKLQVYKLLMGRTDFIVMDKSIFEYYKNELVYEKRVPKGIKINFFNFLKPTKLRTAFKDKKIRDDFDLGLKHLRKTGQYNAIYKKYSKKYFQIEK